MGVDISYMVGELAPARVLSEQVGNCDGRVAPKTFLFVNISVGDFPKIGAVLVVGSDTIVHSQTVFNHLAIDVNSIGVNMCQEATVKVTWYAVKLNRNEASWRQKIFKVIFGSDGPLTLRLAFVI